MFYVVRFLLVTLLCFTAHAQKYTITFTNVGHNRQCEIKLLQKAINKFSNSQHFTENDLYISCQATKMVPRHALLLPHIVVC